MTKYLWRQILFGYLLLFGGFVTFYQMLMIISDPVKNLKYLPLFIGLLFASIVSFVILKKLGISNTEFIEIMKKNGFMAEHKVLRSLGGKIPTFIGLRDDGTLIYASFANRYWPEIRNLINVAGTGTRNLQFYFPCHRASALNHNIVKSSHEIEIGHGIYPFRDHSKIKSTNAELKTILSGMCADIDFLISPS